MKGPVEKLHQGGIGPSRIQRARSRARNSPLPRHSSASRRAPGCTRTTNLDAGASISAPTRSRSSQRKLCLHKNQFPSPRTQHFVYSSADMHGLSRSKRLLVSCHRNELRNCGPPSPSLRASLRAKQSGGMVATLAPRQAVMPLFHLGSQRREPRKRAPFPSMLRTHHTRSIEPTYVD